MERLPAETDRIICQREDMGSPRGEPHRGRIHILPEGNQAIWTPSTVSVRAGSLGETHTCVEPEASCVPARVRAEGGLVRE